MDAAGRLLLLLLPLAQLLTWMTAQVQDFFSSSRYSASYQGKKTLVNSVQKSHSFLQTGFLHQSVWYSHSKILTPFFSRRSGRRPSSPPWPDPSKTGLFGGFRPALIRRARHLAVGSGTTTSRRRRRRSRTARGAARPRPACRPGCRKSGMEKEGAERVSIIEYHTISKIRTTFRS